VLRIRNVYPDVPDLDFSISDPTKKEEKNQLNEQAKKKIRVH
jgi:hypothetical protein